MRTFTKTAKEETGKAPACTGALLEIKKITRGYIKAGDSEWSQTNAGCKQYVVQLQIKAPKGAVGMSVFDRITVGTPDDKEAAKEATWDVSEGGPARLARLLIRSGTRRSDDDEDWMEDARGRTVVAPIIHRGEFVNVGLYYRENDKDAPEIALTEGGKKGAVKRRAATVADDDEEEDEKPKKATVDEDEDDEPTPKKGKAKPKVEEEDEDEKEEKDDTDDDEEDEKPKSKKKPAKKPPKEEEEDDDD